MVSVAATVSALFPAEAGKARPAPPGQRETAPVALGSDWHSFWQFIAILFVD